MKIQSILLVCNLMVITAPVCAQSQPVTLTATVKKIEGYGESGDAYTFKTVSGKRYMVYNAGGSSPIQGEALIQQSLKTKQPICLVLDHHLNEPRMVQAAQQGPCKRYKPASTSHLD